MTDLALPVPDELVEAVAQRAAELVLERLEPQDEILDSKGAAKLLGTSVGQIHNLVTDRRKGRGGIPFHQERPGCKLYYKRSELLSVKGLDMHPGTQYVRAAHANGAAPRERPAPDTGR